MQDDRKSDIKAIGAVIRRQFESLSWVEGGGPDWLGFRGDFREGAALFPSARPLLAETVDAFAERMNGLVGTSLRSFDEKVLRSRIHLFGNVAVAVVACENVANSKEVDRAVEMMLLVKDSNRWQIVAQGWDKEHPGMDWASAFDTAEA
jgi:hypothetical protein